MKVEGYLLSAAVSLTVCAAPSLDHAEVRSYFRANLHNIACSPNLPKITDTTTSYYNVNGIPK